jgi:hypothetical protein
MLGSQFSAIFANFRWQKMAFFLKSKDMIKFLLNFSSVLSHKRPIFSAKKLLKS